MRKDKPIFLGILLAGFSLFCTCHYAVGVAADVSALARSGKQSDYRFLMVMGDHRPICKAYLQRLNTADFVRPPYCGITEQTKIPGFEPLNRVALDAQSANRLFSKVYNFWFPIRGREGDSVRSLRDGSTDVTNEVGEAIVAWRYQPRVDINNDGHPTNIIVWQGYGLTTGSAPCGFIKGNTGTRSRQLPIVFNEDFTEVLEKQSESLLKGSVKLTITQTRFGSASIASSRFSAIGRSVGIFKYRNQCYLDAFREPSADYAGQRLRNPEVANILDVYARSLGKTKKLCTYQLQGHDYPNVDGGS